MLEHFGTVSRPTNLLWSKLTLKTFKNHVVFNFSLRLLSPSRISWESTSGGTNNAPRRSEVGRWTPLSSPSHLVHRCHTIHINIGPVTASRPSGSSKTPTKTSTQNGLLRASVHTFLLQKSVQLKEWRLRTFASTHGEFPRIPRRSANY